MSTNIPYDQMSQEPESYPEFAILMSLALDGLLDADEEKQFYADLGRYPALASEWQLWQEMDSKLLAEPAMEPPVDFARKVELRLAEQQRRRRIWFGMAIGTVSVLLWSCLLIAVASMGAYIVVNQGGWLSDQIHNIAYTFSTISSWFVIVVDAVSAAGSTPQAWGALAIYLAVSGVLLFGWLRFLQRTVHGNELSVGSAI